MIPALDRGLHFGDCVFEGIVAFGTKMLDFSEHYDRLRESADMIAMEIPYRPEELIFEIEYLLGRCNTPKTAIKLMITRGNGLGLTFPAHTSPNKFIFALPATRFPAELYTRGMALKLKQQSAKERGATAKTNFYLPSLLAVNRAQEEGFDDILWVNQDGEITESSIANIFLIGRTGDRVEIATPAATSGLLKGITRQRLMALLTSAKIPVTERTIFEDEIPYFDEAFLCSTVRGLVPLHRIGRHQLHTSRTQAVFHQVKRLFETWVTVSVGRKVDWNTGTQV